MTAFRYLIAAAVLTTYAVAQSTEQIKWFDNWAVGCTFDYMNIIDELSINLPGCKSTCSSDQRCTHFIWRRSKVGSCYLMSGTVERKDARQTNKDVVCGVFPENPGVPSGEEIDWQKDHWAFGCDFPDRGFMKVQTDPTTGKDCGGKCGAKRGCTHFTWKRGICYLKSGVVHRSSAISVNDTNVVCGFKGNPDGDTTSPLTNILTIESPPKPVDWQNGDWAFGCVFFQTRSELKVWSTPRSQCRESCVANLECSHFTWTPEDGICKLMSGAVSKADAMQDENKAKVCGVLSCSTSSALRPFGLAKCAITALAIAALLLCSRAV